MGEDNRHPSSTPVIEIDWDDEDEDPTLEFDCVAYILTEGRQS